MPVTPNIFEIVPQIVTAFTAGAQGLVALLMTPPMSYAIALGFAGWGFRQIRGFIKRG